jgi:hypothetical protein
MINFVHDLHGSTNPRETGLEARSNTWERLMSASAEALEMFSEESNKRRDSEGKTKDEQEGKVCMPSFDPVKSHKTFVATTIASWRRVIQMKL